MLKVTRTIAAGVKPLMLWLVAYSFDSCYSFVHIHLSSFALKLSTKVHQSRPEFLTCFWLARSHTHQLLRCQEPVFSLRRLCKVHADLRDILQLLRPLLVKRTSSNLECFAHEVEKGGVKATVEAFEFLKLGPQRLTDSATRLGEAQPRPCHHPHRLRASRPAGRGQMWPGSCKRTTLSDDCGQTTRNGESSISGAST